MAAPEFTDIPIYNNEFDQVQILVWCNAHKHVPIGVDCPRELQYGCIRPHCKVCKDEFVEIDIKITGWKDIINFNGQGRCAVCTAGIRSASDSAQIGQDSLIVDVALTIKCMGLLTSDEILKHGKTVCKGTSTDFTTRGVPGIVIDSDSGVPEVQAWPCKCRINVNSLGSIIESKDIQSLLRKNSVLPEFFGGYVIKCPCCVDDANCGFITMPTLRVCGPTYRKVMDCGSVRYMQDNGLM